MDIMMVALQFVEDATNESARRSNARSPDDGRIVRGRFILKARRHHMVVMSHRTPLAMASNMEMIVTAVAEWDVAI